MPPSSRGALGASRFAHIDGMRAVAVLLVVVAHAGLGNVVPGGSGVTIFFAISGFIITYLLLREHDASGTFNVGGFYFRRAAKIFPPFILIVVVPTLVWVLFGPLRWLDFLAQVFFVFNWAYIGGDVEVLPGSAVVWSLAVEEQFYIVFALVWLLLVRARWWQPALVGISVLAIVYSSSVRFLLAGLGDSERRIYYGTDTRMDAIAMGVLVAVLIYRWTSSGSAQTRMARGFGSDWVFVSATLVYLSSLLIRDEWFRDTLRYSFQGIAASLLIVYGFMPGNSWLKRAFHGVSAWRPVAIVGLASYSIYLVHLSLDFALRPITDTWPIVLKVPVVVIAGVLAGIVVYFAVEVPVLSWRKKRDAARHRRRVAEIENVGRDAGI